MDYHSFRAELKRFDRALDLEFHSVKGLWQVVGYDRRGRRYVIYHVPLGKLGEFKEPILAALYSCSPERKSAAEIDRELEEAERRRDAALDRQLQDDLEQAALETWDSWQRREGERINTTGLPGAGYKVLDRRRVKPDDL